MENGSVTTIDQDPSSNESPNLNNDYEIFPSNDGERCIIHIGEDIYVVAKTYNDKLQIHIRKYNRFDTQLYPTKNPSLWLNLPQKQSQSLAKLTPKAVQTEFCKTP